MHFVRTTFEVVCSLFLLIDNVKAPFQPPESEAVPLQAVHPPQTPPNEQEDTAEYYEDRIANVDSHTFVALLDIMFTDGSKKICTGAIIADHAVITAAHCFITRNEAIQPELTLSFVIIGTKKMIETGYEMYLPIERIETHPNFKGWTADLAIVFTFAGMVTDRPGTIVPLAGERSSTPVDSNVTVFSWGRCKEGNAAPEATNKEETAYPPSGDPFEERTTEDTSVMQQHPTQIRASMKSKSLPVLDPKKKNLRSVSIENNYRTNLRPDVQPYKVLHAQRKQRVTSENLAKNAGSRYLSDTDEEVKKKNIRHRNRHRVRRSLDKYEISANKSGRRASETEPNKLTVEIFGFVNAQTCKKLVDRSVPPLYGIKNKNEVLCYTSDMHYITVEDSGAPALQHGKLVAVTVGGVESEGEHVAVGMKMSCFCSWIVETLPMYEDLVKIKCCKNCCEVKHSPTQDQAETNASPHGSIRRGKPNQRYREVAAGTEDENQYFDHAPLERNGPSDNQYSNQFIPEHWKNEADDT